jgi:glutamine synthetase type III
VLGVLKRLIKEHKRVIFDGDNYSEEWHAEAERRGLTPLYWQTCKTGKRNVCLKSRRRR